ncbi:MAG: acyltransferase [Devosia sp.]
MSSEVAAKRPTQETATRKGNLEGIQYLRGYAAVAVVIAHAYGFAATPKYYGDFSIGAAQLASGVHGVDLFFVISGFIVAYITLNRESLTPRLSALDFFQRRFVRIVPIMWIAILSFWALRSFVASDGDWFDYLRALTLWPSGGVAPPQIWTLRHELIFYLFFGLFVLAFPRGRWLLVVVAVGPLPLQLVTPPEWIGTILNLVNLQFALGALAALIYLRGPPVAAKFVIKRLGHVIVLALFVVMLLVSVSLEPFGNVTVVLGLGGMSVMILWLATMIDGDGSRGATVARLLGDASYSIYLFHLHFIQVLLVLAPQYAPMATPHLVVPAAALIAALGGILLHLVVERPLLNWLQTTRPTGSRRAADS